MSPSNGSEVGEKGTRLEPDQCTNSLALDFTLYVQFIIIIYGHSYPSSSTEMRFTLRLVQPLSLGT